MMKGLLFVGALVVAESVRPSPLAARAARPRLRVTCDDDGARHTLFVDAMIAYDGGFVFYVNSAGAPVEVDRKPRSIVCGIVAAEAE